MDGLTTTTTERAELRAARRRSPGSFFAPRTIAVIGASGEEGSVGRSLLENLSEFDGRVFPVNPNPDTILGATAFREIDHVAEKVDLGRGVGTLLLKKLVEVGREERLGLIRGTILGCNSGMRRLCERVGFKIRQRPEEPDFEASLTL